MYIRNIKTGIVQECSNKDVIKICQKDAENYQVTERDPVAWELENVDKIIEPERPVIPEKTLEDMTVPELKASAKEKGIEGTSSLSKDDLLAVLKEVE